MIVVPTRLFSIECSFGKYLLFAFDSYIKL
jgi:hypothetical protein